MHSDQASITKTASPRTIPEVDRLKIHNLFLQQQLLRQQLNALISQFLQAPEPRALQERIDELVNQTNALVTSVFVSSGIDPNEYQFNVHTGEFIAKKSPA